jgi:chemotaxis protein MotB
LPHLSSLKGSVKVEVTDEGLHIQLLDQAGTSLFQSGSARLTRDAELLLLLVANMVQRMPNEITISGHTDATPYSDSQDRTNWELSLERANVSRRELLRHGVKGKRIASIVGFADKVPLLVDNPTSPQNRRVSILLLREKVEIKKKTPPKPPRVL